MSKVITLRKGLDINLQGKPCAEAAAAPQAALYAVSPLDFEGVTPKLLVKAGDKVKAGQLLCEVDMKLVKEKGYKMHTPILVTNADDCRDIRLIPDKDAKAGKTTVITYRK